MNIYDRLRDTLLTYYPSVKSEVNSKPVWTKFGGWPGQTYRDEEGKEWRFKDVCFESEIDIDVTGTLRSLETVSDQLKKDFEDQMSIGAVTLENRGFVISQDMDEEIYATFNIHFKERHDPPKVYYHNHGSLFG